LAAHRQSDIRAIEASVPRLGEASLSIPAE
jgi:hypothetical protein